MATTHSKVQPLNCNCNTYDLLKRAINLIDPPLYPVDEIADDNVVTKDGQASRSIETSQNSTLKNDETSNDQDLRCALDDGTSRQPDPADESITTLTKQKKVRFQDTAPGDKRNKISIQDVIHAHELLSHSIAMQPQNLSDESLFCNTSWSSLQQHVDTYRALLITCNLLMEMLPLPIESNDDLENADPDWLNCYSTCPSTKPTSIPSITSAITQQLLSKSRRCILMLQCLEKICAAKSISERHTLKTKFYSGGDDIEDYDRCTSDMHMNYDWHDDGFLPQPGSYKINCSAKSGSCDTTSILFECCYRPHKVSVQPSSRYERIASTKEWVRGERLISMTWEDYEYYDECRGNNDYFLQPNTTSTIQSQGYTSDCTPDGSAHIDEETPFFTLSPNALCQEEEKLLDIMVPIEHTNSTLTNAAPKQKKKKRKRTKHTEQTTVSDHHINRSSLQWKEGYLYLGCAQDLPLKNRVYVKVRTCIMPYPFAFCNSFPTATTIKLHPSGWLSVEDRSISPLGSTNAEVTNSKLLHRIRYRDYFVMRSSKCEPWTADGVMSFHFCVDAVLNLGASALGECNGKSNDGAVNNDNLLFAVDEATGGSLLDGFEWVSAITEIITSSNAPYKC